MTTRAPRRRPRSSATAERAPAPRNRPNRIGGWAVLLAIAPILVATLTPSAYEGAQGWDGCVLCGSRGGADALLNVVLFAPLGAALALRRLRLLPALVFAAAFSAGVELAQLVVPGRDPSPPDLLFNTLGAAAGFAAGLRLGALLRPSPRAADGLALGWSALFATMVIATSRLTLPSPPPGPYVGQWMPRTGDHPVLPGRMLDARIGAVRVPFGTVEGDERVRAALARGEPLAVRWIAGRRIARPAPLLRIVGRGGDEAAALFIHGDDVLVLRRMRASDAGLDAPVLRAPGALRGTNPGDTMALTVRFAGRSAWVGTDAGRGVRDGFGPARGWALLMARLEAGRAEARWLDALWAAMWMAPLGLWLRRRPASFAAVAVAGAALLILPPFLALAPVGVVAVAGAIIGLLGGAALRRAVGPRLHR